MHRDESGLCQAHRVGIPEFFIINYIKEMVPEGGTFIDCGAHMGVYSVYLSDNFKQIYAFEPQRRTYNQLCGNLFINEISNVQPFNAAVSDSSINTLQSLYVVSEDGGGSTLIKPDDDQILSEESVKVVKIDDFEFENVDLIKLDIEGKELNALSGAIKTILKYRPTVIFESNSGRENYKNRLAIYAWFKEIGYIVDPMKNFDNMFIAYDKEI